MTRRVLVTLAVLAIVGYAAFMIMYEIVGIDFDSSMENQPSIHSQEPPRRLLPQNAVPVSRPTYLDDMQSLSNPVPADEVSLQRGELLYGFHCALCHGPTGQGEGPITEFWQDGPRRPPNLTEARIGQYPDSTLYQIVSQGIGGMPPLRENLTERQRWDVINHVRGLQP
jgi:mono/diheme cytochrome c family protein